MANWKDGINVVVSAYEPTGMSTDSMLAMKLKLVANKLPAGDIGFATSLLAGFNRYHGFTDRQRPYVEKLIAKGDGTAPVVSLEERAQGADWLDVSTIPAGRYAIETRRYRINRPVEGKWAGWTFIDDGSAYGFSEKYASQKPDSKIARIFARNASLVVGDLRAIAANPAEACATYGRITGSCGICGRVLENEESVARGIGPVCAEKAGW